VAEEACRPQKIGRGVRKKYFHRRSLATTAQLQTQKELELSGSIISLVLKRTVVVHIGGA
jgi:hypothetical protein